MHKSTENYTDSLVPPYMHLALDREHAADVLSDAVGRDPRMIEQMLSFIYDDMHISRLGAHVVKDELERLARAGSIKVAHFACDRPQLMALSPRLERRILARHPELARWDLNALGCALVVHKL